VIRRPLVILGLWLAASPLQAAWNQNGYWDDERAEVAVYEAERFVDGYLVRYEQTNIVRKEELRRDTLVRTEKGVPGQTLTAFKMNQIQSYLTRNMPVNLLTSIYAEDEAMDRAVKISVGWQEWDGNAYKLFTRKGVHCPHDSCA
jgi:hypothetical protein